MPARGISISLAREYHGRHSRRHERREQERKKITDQKEEKRTHFYRSRPKMAWYLNGRRGANESGSGDG